MACQAKGGQVAISEKKLRGLSKMLGAALIILSSYGCVNPNIDNTNIGIPTLESVPDSRPSSEPAAIHSNEERNEPVA
jgi:hypothetical protein